MKKNGTSYQRFIGDKQEPNGNFRSKKHRN